MSEQLVVPPKKSLRLTQKEQAVVASLISRFNQNLFSPMTDAEDRALSRALRLVDHVLDELRSRRGAPRVYADGKPDIAIHPSLQETPIQ